MKFLISGYTNALVLLSIDDMGNIKQERTISAPPYLSFLVPDVSGDLFFGVQELPTGIGSVCRSNFLKQGDVQYRPVGRAPCHLCLSPDSKWLAVANYLDGSIDLFQIDKSRRIRSESWRAIHKGRGPNKDRQDQAHAHGVLFTQNCKRLLVCDLGIDSVISYSVPQSFDRTQKSLAGRTVITTEPGDGPRHLVMNKSETRAYLVNELSNTVEVYAYDSDAGIFTRLQRRSTLPEDVQVLSNTASEIALHPTERFLYVSNRGHDSIVSFALESVTGTLGNAEFYATQGKTPRHFFFDSSGHFLIVANQGSNEVCSFHVNDVTGELIWTGSTVFANQPTCGFEIPDFKNAINTQTLNNDR